MYTQNLLCLWVICSALALALTIPQVQNGALVRRDARLIDTPVHGDVLKRAVPAKSKPAAAAKAPAKGIPPKANPAAPAKPPVKGTPPKATPAVPAKTPANGIPPKATPTPPAKPVVWPNVKVPYVTTAFDTCGIFVDCDGSGVDDPQDIAARAVTITQENREVPAPTPAPPLVRKDIRTFPVPAAQISIKNLDYPGAKELFAQPRDPKVKLNVFDHNSPDIADYKVKNLKKEPANYDDYVTEHIVELQSVKMFMTDTAKANTKLKAFFKTWWNKELDSVKVGNRPNKPSITMGDQTTINNLVFEALGSDNNKEDFVLCEDEINGYKARMWKKVAPMQNRKYGDAVKDAVAGKSTSNIYLSGLRNTLAVLEYLKDPEVVSRLQASIKNVGMELKNVEHLTQEKLDLATEWDKWMKAHLAEVKTKAKTWIEDRIDKDTTKRLADEIATLKKKEADLKKEETGKNKDTHDKTAKATSDKLDVEIKTAKTAVTAQEKVVNTKQTELEVKRGAFSKKKAELKKKDGELATLAKTIAKEKDATKLAALDKQKKVLEQEKTQLEVEKNTAEQYKKTAETARDSARKDLLTKQKAVGLKEREKWLLRSVWLGQVIDGLEKDQAIVKKFKAAGAAA